MAECEPSSDVEGNMTAQGPGSLVEDKTSAAVDPEKKEIVGKNDKVEETSMLNGSAPPAHKSEGNTKPHGIDPLADNKTSVVVESEKNETADKNEKVEETSMLNGSAPPERKSAEPNSGEEGNKNEINEEEDDKDKKHAEVNSTAKENDAEESKEGNSIKDVSTAAKENDVEEIKEDNNIEDKSTLGKENEIEETKEDNNIEDASTTVKENEIEETKKDKKMEGVSTSKAEDVKMHDAEGDKTVEDASITAKVNDVEESKEDKTNDASTPKSADEKMTDLEGDEAVDVQDTTMADAEDVKDEGGAEEGEEKGVDQEAKEGDNDTKEQENETIEEKANEDKETKGFKRKRTPVQKTKNKGKDSATKAKELLNRPMTSSIDRPVRERKTVERLVEVIEKEASREFQVEKGRGTPLKDIPHVAHKLAKKKPADIKLIHQTLFGRKGKAVNFKHHILQFSGFVWHESDEKQRAKMKEKLDKYIKDTLLDLCDLFDLPVVSKANTRKEDLVEKLLDFLVAPHPTNESTKSRKRKRVAKGIESKDMEDIHSKRSRKKGSFSHNEGEKSGSEMDDEDEDGDFDSSGSYKGKVAKHSESEDGDNELEQVSEEGEHEKKDREKGKRDKKKDFKKEDSVGKEKVGTASKLGPILPTTKSPKTSSSKRSKAVGDDVGAKVFSRKKKIADSPKKKPTPRSTKKEKDTGKKARQNKTKSEAEPNKEELRKKICEILKEVDFNTATFTDILKQLAAYYKLDLTPRKASIKLIIQEELTKLAEAEDDEDDEDEEDEEDQEPAVKEVEV